MIKKLFTQPNIYTISALLYLTVGDLVSGIKILTLASHGIYLVMSLYYIYAVLTKCRLTIFMKVLTALFAAFMFYGLIFLIVGTDSFWIVQNVSPVWNLKLHFNSFAPLYAFYYFGSKKMIDEKWFRIIGVVFLFAIFFQYSSFSDRAMLKYDRDLGEFTNNSGYYWLSILPIVVFYKNKPALSFVLLAYISVMIIMCMKRGAVIIGGLLDIYFIITLLKNSKNRFWISAISIFVLLFVGYFFMDFVTSNSFAAARMEATIEGDSSSRNRIYSFYLDYFLHKTDVFNFLVGNGACATGRIMGAAAHNDWLEIAICMGLIGVLFYLYYWITNFKTIIHAIKYSGNETIIMVLTAIILTNFMKTLFSMSINDMMLCSNAMLGYCLSKVYGDDCSQNNESIICQE